jgi:hypothetical protein
MGIVIGQDQSIREAITTFAVLDRSWLWWRMAV